MTKRLGDPDEALPVGLRVGNAGKPKHSWIHVGFLVFVLAVAGTVRIYGVTTMGLHGSDTVYYSNVAQEWRDGNFVFQIATATSYHRPVVFATFAAGIAAFGHNDYSIKLTNALVDVLNVFLTFSIAFLIGGRRPWPASCAALVLATLPMSVVMSRGELTHTVSTLTVLLCCLSLVFFNDARTARQRTISAVFTGIFAGLTALTHEELIFVGPGCVLFIAVRQLQDRSNPNAIKRAVRELLAFLIPFLFAIQGLATRHFELAVWRANFVSGAGGPDEPGFSLFGYLERWARFVWDSTLANGSAPLVVLFVLAIGFALGSWLHRAWKRREAPTETIMHVPMVFTLVYIGTYSVFFSWYQPRLFLPFIPLVLVSVFVWVDLLWTRFGRRFSALVALGLALVLALFNFARYPEDAEATSNNETSWFPVEFAGVSFEKSWRLLMATSFGTSSRRRVFDELAGKVGPDSKLLVSPSIAAPTAGRRALQSSFYFGDNVVYVLDHHEKTLSEIIDRNDVRYVLFDPTRLQFRYLHDENYDRYINGDEWERVPLNRGASRFLAPGRYSVQKEFDSLLAHLTRREAALIDRHETSNGSEYFLWDLRPPNINTRRPESTSALPMHSE